MVQVLDITGLGIYSMFDTMQYCFLASYSQTLHLQGNILQNVSSAFTSSSISVKGVTKDMPSLVNMSRRDSVLWQCNKTKHAQDYLLAIPAYGLGQKMGPRQFCVVLCYRLGIPLFAENSVCLL